MDSNIEILTYRDLRSGLHFDRDKYNVLSYQYDTRRKTLLANPYLKDDNRPYMITGLADNVIVGRTTLFPVKFKTDDSIIDGVNGTSFHVEKNYRKSGIGAEIFMTQMKNCGADVKISAGISAMALPMNRIVKNVIFQFPKFWQIRNCRAILSKLGIKGMLLSVISRIINYPLHAFCNWQLTGGKKIIKSYAVKQETIVPEWIDEIVLNDGHKYMEVHDHQWMQWNLDNNFCGGEGNYQVFLTIYKNDNPAGFILLKYREYKEYWRMKDAVVCSIVEWGIKKEETLTEKQLIQLAAMYVKNNVDILEFATEDTSLANFMKRRLFMQVEDANVSVKDIKRQFPDFGKVELWRLRLGYSDVILST